ncbi:nuclear transport factor 2 family protein [Nocardia salmonicida]|uniref:hypothetical protein n=1 Tax=Nocardia salmonicida TaxID=53431 RepID=UPI0007A41444|nr:hypothetical protein [Nocardia salmonicida]
MTTTDTTRPTESRRRTIVRVGTHYQGRADVTEAHRALFSGFLKGSKLADSFLDIRFYGADVAIVTSRSDRYDKNKPAELSKTQTYTLVREPDGPATKPAAER